MTRVAARASGPLDGGVPVARGGRVAPDSTLTAFPAASMLRVGPTTYAAGVGWLGAYRGSGLVLASEDGRLRSALGTDGQISDAVPDGRGGAFVGGEFTRAGGLRRSAVVHVGADGVLLRRFAVRGLRFVNALAAGRGRLYIGGSLGRDDARGAGVVAVDRRTGRIDRRFRAPATGRVSELELRSGRLYAGGALPDAPVARATGRRPTVPGNGAQPSVAEVALPVVALDPATGRADRRFRPPSVPASMRGQVTVLRMIGGRLWVGTGFPGSSEATMLRILRPIDGGLVAAPQARGAFAEIVQDGSRAIVVGGLLRSGGGRDLAQAFDAQTGARRPGFAVPAAGPRDVAADAVIRGDRLLLAGARGRTGRNSSGDRGPVPAPGFVVATWLRDGATDRAFRAPVPDSGVHALASLRGGLLVGGAFAAVDVRSTDLAAFDATTGRPSAAPVPRVPGARDVTVAAGKVWVTDGFSLVAFDPVTGAIRHRAAVPFRGGDASDERGRYRTAAPVRLTAAGGRVFVFGGTRGTGGTTHGIAAFDAATAKRVAFRLPLRTQTRGTPVTLLGVGSDLYVGESFKRRRPSGQQADMAVLKVDPRTGELDERFDAHVDGPVQAIGTEGPGRPLFIAGYFTVPGKSARPGNLSAVDPVAGTRIRTIGASPLRSDPSEPLSVTADHAVVREGDGSRVGMAFDRSGRRVAVGVPGARYVSTTDGGRLVAAGAPGLLGFHTPADYGVIRARTAGR